MKKIYIAGPMSNIKDFNYPAFNEAAAQLRALGYHVENPAENQAPKCGTWAGYMRNAITQMMTCEAVALLPGWENSRGANVERRLACELGMQVAFVRDYIEQKGKSTLTVKTHPNLFFLAGANQ